MLKHYIITGFNLPRENSLDKNGNPTMTPEYLETRFELFDQFCFPSIFGQTNQNFTWLVLFSDKTDGAFREKITSYRERMPNFTPLYLTDADAMKWRGYVTNYIRLNTKEDNIITSRLDNDDSYQISYIERVQNLVNDRKLTRAFIAFPYGQRYATSHKVAFASQPIPYNHYISLIMPNDKNFKIVFFCDHTKLEETGIPVIIDDENKAMWLEVIHNTNVINNVNPEDLYHPVRNKECLKEFNIDISVKEYKIKRYLIFELTRLHINHVFRMIKNKWRAMRKKDDDITLPVKCVRFMKGNCRLLLLKLQQYFHYKKGKRIANKLYDKKYLETKEFCQAENKLTAVGWTWAINDYKARKSRKMNVGVPFPVSPLNTVWGYENITFDPSDLTMFQGSGKYIQAGGGGHIYIGKGTYIANNVGIVTSNHDIRDPDHHMAGEDIMIGEKCWIALNAVILPGVVLGDHTTVGAGAVVTKSFPKGHCVIAGNPARIIKVLDRRYMR